MHKRIRERKVTTAAEDLNRAMVKAWKLGRRSMRDDIIDLLSKGLPKYEIVEALEKIQDEIVV
jgi:hypothetical protein